MNAIHKTSTAFDLVPFILSKVKVNWYHCCAGELQRANFDHAVSWCVSNLPLIVPLLPEPRALAGMEFWGKASVTLHSIALRGNIIVAVKSVAFIGGVGVGRFPSRSDLETVVQQR